MVVIIFGAGVAGCACALELIRKGIGCIIIEKSNANQSTLDFGETLPPESSLLLSELLLSEKHDTFGKKIFGVQSSWGHAGIDTRSFSSSIPSYGLLISKFKLVDHFRNILSPTVPIYYGVRKVSLSEKSNGHITDVSFSDIVGSSHSISADFFIDATGRHRFLSRRYSKIQHYDRLIASLSDGFTHTTANTTLSHDMSLIESINTGWWYTASNFSDKRVVARFSDAHDGIARKIKAPSIFLQQISETSWVNQLVEGGEELNKITNFSAASTKLKNIGLKNWVAIGDAARTVDPLSSQGIHNALLDGATFAKALVEYEDNSNIQSQFVEEIEQSYFNYLSKRDSVYSLENRWSSSFWQLRQP
ncbi:MAG: tryptophan 7-halogenase [Oceanospirillaceae bacterium]|nr:tryptophan 7-halogenase [Oceanospirillaceae bacterium]